MSMNNSEARLFAEERCTGMTVPEFFIQTEWGWVFRLESGTKMTFPIIFVDSEFKKIVRLKDNNLEHQIDHYSENRKRFENAANAHKSKNT